MNPAVIVSFRMFPIGQHPMVSSDFATMFGGRESDFFPDFWKYIEKCTTQSNHFEVQLKPGSTLLLEQIGNRLIQVVDPMHRDIIIKSRSFSIENDLVVLRLGTEDESPEFEFTTRHSDAKHSQKVS